MKTFTEYIKESINFRLGGKAKSGYNQSSGTSTTFDELKPGDRIYIMLYEPSGNIEWVNKTITTFEIERVDVDGNNLRFPGHYVDSFNNKNSVCLVNDGVSKDFIAHRLNTSYETLRIVSVEEMTPEEGLERFYQEERANKNKAR